MARQFSGLTPDRERLLLKRKVSKETREGKETLQKSCLRYGTIMRNNRKSTKTYTEHAKKIIQAIIEAKVRSTKY